MNWPAPVAPPVRPEMLVTAALKLLEQLR